ncbi:hypothetical protein BpHYR1_044323 [Brachionus plicatilis]|uniref:Uncharacterized protein n=1 Tax=Brachionus plicatilis TaxID=10195 RepID=A0A3M7T622_BRAPC|nr:hypothetical protein BpHYR1_044323 [Brachionus plicatilis]
MSSSVSILENQFNDTAEDTEALPKIREIIKKNGICEMSSRKYVNLTNFSVFVNSAHLEKAIKNYVIFRSLYYDKK